MATAIIVAAGSSRRMGFNKLLAPLGGVPVLRRTLQAFDRCPSVDELVLVTGEEVSEAFSSWQQEAAMETPVTVLPGGAERHFSVWSGLETIPDDGGLVAVHDGARPLIQPDQIEACFRAAESTGAAVCARRVTETVKRADEEGIITEPVEREGLWIMETPQTFRVGLLKQAYGQVLESGLRVTDEVSAMQHAGIPVHTVENPAPNPKITFPADLEMAVHFLDH